MASSAFSRSHHNRLRWMAITTPTQFVLFEPSSDLAQYDWLTPADVLNYLNFHQEDRTHILAEAQRQSPHTDSIFYVKHPLLALGTFQPFFSWIWHKKAKKNVNLWAPYLPPKKLIIFIAYWMPKKAEKKFVFFFTLFWYPFTKHENKNSFKPKFSPFHYQKLKYTFTQKSSSPIFGLVSEFTDETRGSNNSIAEVSSKHTSQQSTLGTVTNKK